MEAKFITGQHLFSSQDCFQPKLNMHKESVNKIQGQKHLNIVKIVMLLQSVPSIKEKPKLAVTRKALRKPGLFFSIQLQLTVPTSPEVANLIPLSLYTMGGMKRKGNKDT